MPPAELAELVAWVRDVGIIGMLILVLVGGIRRWYYWKWQVEEIREVTSQSCQDTIDGIREAHEKVLTQLRKENEDLREDRDYWRDTSMRSLNVSEAVTGRVNGD